MAKKQTETRGNAVTELSEIIPVPKGYSKIWNSYWNSPEALTRHVESLGNGTTNWNRGAWTHGESFTGTKDMASAIKLCRDGWPQGAATVERLRDKINASNPVGQRMVRYDVAGAMPSIPRALSGNPLNMRRVDNAKLRRRPVLTLLSDMTANGGISQAAITNRAAVVAAVIDAIEAKGFACQVITFECSSDCGIVQIVAATVKESYSPADVGRLAFGLGHASMFRRLSWAAFTENVFTSGLGSGLGAATAIDTAACNERGAYVLRTAGENEHAFKNEKDAAEKGLAWIVDSLREQGCPAFPKEESHAA